MADGFESNQVTMSHKRKSISSYALKYKLEAIAYTENNSINSASKKFNVEKKASESGKVKKKSCFL